MGRRQAGYALLVVMLLAALVLIALAVAVPRLLTQGQREREEEFIFRGEQYQRAIGLYYKKFGRYPNSIKDLLHTNDRSYLRRPWPDPLVPDGKWRLIRLGPGGQLIGSVHTPRRRGSAGASPDEPEEESPTTGESPQLLPLDPGADKINAPIAGVASRLKSRTIRVYEDFEYYHQWEFVYDPVKEAARAAARAGQPTSSPQPKPSAPRR